MILSRGITSDEDEVDGDRSSGDDSKRGWWRFTSNWVKQGSWPFTWEYGAIRMLIGSSSE